jgi:hypothetical protein
MRLVKRYLLHIHIWGEECDLEDINEVAGICVPNEVYFTEYIPEGIELN